MTYRCDLKRNYKQITQTVTGEWEHILFAHHEKHCYRSGYSTKYFPFRKIMICVCRPKKQKKYICESATGVKIYLCLKLRKFNHMFIFHTDIIRSIKLSIKPHSSAPKNAGQRASLWLYVCVQANVSCGACALLTVISQWSNDTNNKIIQIYGHTLIYLRCMAYAFVWHCLS